MHDSECVAFMQWALPRLQLRWPGFRKVRRQVCRRLARRLSSLGLESLDQYRDHLLSTPAEWSVLDRLCRVTISRFFRDRGTWKALEEIVLPQLSASILAGGRRRLRVWCAGCASGEEPYSLSILWHQSLASRYPSLALHVLGTDADLTLLARARRGVYPSGALREAIALEQVSAFEQMPADQWRLRPPFRLAVDFIAHDLKTEPPAAAFDLVLCRNLAFTYYAADLQRRVLDTLRSRITPHGSLVIGSHEHLPAASAIGALTQPELAALGIFRAGELGGENPVR